MTTIDNEVGHGHVDIFYEVKHLMMSPLRNPIEVKGQRIQIPGILLCVVSPDIRNGRHDGKLATRQEPQALINTDTGHSPVCCFARHT